MDPPPEDNHSPQESQVESPSSNRSGHRKRRQDSGVHRTGWSEPNLPTTKPSNGDFMQFTPTAHHGETSRKPRQTALLAHAPRTTACERDCKSLVENLVAAIWENKKNPLSPEMLMMVESLKDKGTAVNQSGNDRGQTVLYSAAKWGNLELVSKLLSIKGVDPNVATVTQSTPLHVAGFEGHDVIVALLLMSGANPNQSNSNNVKAWQDARGTALDVYKIFNSDGRAGISQAYPDTRPIRPSNRNLVYEAEFDVLTKKSDEFQKRIKFPVITNTLKALGTTSAKKITIAEFAMSTRVVIHERVKALLSGFLELKRKEGTSKEQLLYTDMTLEQFIQRLVVKRPLKFFTNSDATTLRNGHELESSSDWLHVGTENEGALKIEDYMTYDEMSVAALIGASVPTYFINPGGRINAGIPSTDPTFPSSGIYVGLVGARFEKRGLMETQYVLQFPSNDDKQTPMHRLWAWFFLGKEKRFPTHEEILNLPEEHIEKYFATVAKSVHFKEKPIFFNINVYQKRMQLTIETFLCEANYRGKKKQKFVYCHVVGLGLGIWQVVDKQATWILDMFLHAIESHSFPWIRNLDFSWFPDGCECAKLENGTIFKNTANEIAIRYSRRAPADPLTGPDAAKLLVAMYAWDGNAYPGNEYWSDMLTTSGDPAAACCSMIQELQNPEINGHLLNNIWWARPKPIPK